MILRFFVLVIGISVAATALLSPLGQAHGPIDQVVAGPMPARVALFDEVPPAVNSRSSKFRKAPYSGDILPGSFTKAHPASPAIEI